MEFDKKVDMWSIGCILYELLTNEILFPATSPKNLMYMARIFQIFFLSNQILNFRLKSCFPGNHFLLKGKMTKIAAFWKILKGMPRFLKIAEKIIMYFFF